MLKLNECLGKINEFRAQREEIVKKMTTCLQGGETRTALFAVFRGEQSKEVVFGELIGKVRLQEDELAIQTAQSREVTDTIVGAMKEFNDLKAGASQDKSVLKFFSDIDEGLRAYNENINLLSNGANFYKQMHQYLTSLSVFVNDFVQSRSIEKQELMNVLNQGGGAPQGGAPAGFHGPPGGSYYPGAPYMPK